MQKIDPLVKQIGQLIDARFHTFETNIKAYINAVIGASEDRITKNLRGEIKASEERVTKNLRGEIKDSEDRMTKKLQTVEDKLDGKVNKLEIRTERLEKHTGLASPTS